MIRCKPHWERSIRLPLVPFRLEIDGMILECRPKLVRPGKLFVLRKEHAKMADTFRFKFGLPAPENPADVATRKIVAKIGGEVFGEYEVDKAATETGWIPSPDVGFPVDATVSLSIVDSDAKGNPTAGDSLDLVVIDDVGPPKPGALFVLAKDQVIVPETPPTPA